MRSLPNFFFFFFLFLLGRDTIELDWTGFYLYYITLCFRDDLGSMMSGCSWLGRDDGDGNR